MNAKAILAAARALPVEERLSLVQDLWDTIAAEPDQLKITPAEKRLLDERIAADRRHPERTISWPAARRYVRQQVRAAKKNRKKHS